MILGVVGLVIGAKSPSGVFSSQDKENALSMLQRGKQKDGSFLGLKNTYFATQTYNLLKTPVPAKDQVCEFASKALKSMNAEDIFYTAAIESALSCASSIATNSKVYFHNFPEIQFYRQSVLLMMFCKAATQNSKISHLLCVQLF